MKMFIQFFFLVSLLSISTVSQAYVAGCGMFFGVPSISGSWSKNESRIWTYFFLDYEFTQLWNMEYVQNDSNGSVPYDQADWVVTWISNPSSGEWGLDGNFHMSRLQLSPFLWINGPLDNCSGDVIVP